jgi:6-phosphofructokinase 1
MLAKTDYRRIGVLTSGGDAPGMNAAIRGVAYSANHKGWEVVGIRSGFVGLVSGDFVPLGIRELSGIIQQGGTILKTSRFPGFMEQQNQDRALDNLTRQHIGAIVIIGGDGSLAGAYALAQHGFRVVGLGATIDNDVIGADLTIGVDTALNVAIEAIDRLKVTAASHDRAFLVEVMGRHSGYLALASGIAGGAEVIVVPEVETEPARVADELRRAYDHGHAHALVVVAEGSRHSAESLAQYFGKYGTSLGFELRVTKLGHVQRGGVPTVFDRLLGTRLGVASCNSLAVGETGVSLGVVGGSITATPLSETVSRKKPLDPELVKLPFVLAY